MAARSINEVVLAYLSRREYSRFELERRLSAKHYTSVDIATCLDAMQAKGYLSDSRYTQSYIRHRSLAGVGPLRICAELRQRGIQVDKSSIYFQEIDWDERMASVWSRKFDQIACGNKARAKQMRFLLQRGFEPASVQRLLNDI
jgi:regulatory protein